MKQFKSKTRLCASAAPFVVIIALGSTTAQAQCVTNTTTVTCSGTVTAAQVNASINAVAPPSATIRIQPDATVVRDAASVQPASTFVGAVDFGNAGTLGTTAAPVGFTYLGSPAVATNTLALANSGSITGQVFASGVGGPISATNTGTLSGGLNLSGSGNITLTSSGPIYVANGGAGSTAISLQSFRSTSTTTGTVGTDALTTNTTTGGTTSATINAPVAIPASGTSAAVPQSLFLFGIEGAQLTLNAAAGAVTVQAQGTNSTSTPGGGNTAVVDGVATTNNASSSTGVGGPASATLGLDGRASSVGVFSGPGGSTASIAGIVGSATSSGTVNAQASGANNSNSSRFVNSATASSSQSSGTNTPTGGAALVDIASTGQVFGSVQASSNAGAATVNVAGTVGAGNATNVTTLGNVNATSLGNRLTTATTSSNTFATGDFTNGSTTTRGATGAAAQANVAATGAVFGSVTANGDASAAVDNAGRIRDGVSVISNRNLQIASQNNGSQVTTAGAGGASTVVNANSSSSTNAAVGGAGSFTNRAGGVVEDGVNINAIGNVTLDNGGAVFGSISANSAGFTTTNTNSASNTVTSTPATAGGALVRSEVVSSSNSTSAPAGGSVAGTYSGTVGAVAGSPLAGFRTVSQNGQTGSVATISGTLYADVNLNSGATATTSSSNSSTVTTTQPFVAPATPASETVSTTSSRTTSTVQAANNAVTVTGSLRDNGSGTGDLSVFTPSGAAAATITGGTVTGGITVNASGVNATSGNDSVARSTVAATTAGPVAGSVAQSATNTSFSTNQAAAGTSAVTLTGATVGGGVNVFGRGTGAGSTAAALTVSSDTTVAGNVQVRASGAGDTRTDTSDVATRTAANAVTRTVTSATAQTVPTNFGNATATLGGRVSAASVTSSFGAATANLTGQVLGSIDVGTGQTLSNFSSQTTSSGTSTATLATPTLTGFTSSFSNTSTGGAASLNINSSAALQAAGTSAVNGSINVSGLAGSTLTIAAGTRVIQTNAGSVFAGGFNENTAGTQTSTYNAAGVETGRVTTNTTTNVGGPATITNAGIIGASAGFFGSPVSVRAESVGGAAVTNTGTIYGSVFADALDADSSSTTTATGLNDAVITRTVTTTTATGKGGAAAITNSGVVSGSATLVGATGTLANTGVIRGGVFLGDQLSVGSATATVTATSSTLAATAPETRFGQTYTVNQNGLLIGGVNVNGATIADPSTGAAATATLQTSNITANVNLGNNSITTGNIIAQRAPDNLTRLTNTTVTLTGTGTLGVGTFDTPTAALGVGAAPLRFVNTANYGAFAGIDPALGNSATGTFVPAVGIVSGSAIRGATLVEKTGTGTFTIVGTPFIAPSNATPVTTYTMDVGTFRVSAGEVQLGVAGADGATGASIFGIRGNVENNATLLLGRRVTDGSTTVVQGTNVRVDGNFTQASTGTTAVAVAPALVRANGTVVGAQPAQGVLGFGGFGVGLTPFVAFNPTTPTSLRSTPSSLTVSGNATLAGAISLVTTPGAIYTAGRNFDLFTVGGTYNGSGLSVTTANPSPFVKFVVTPRTVGTTTVVSVDVARTSYASVTSTTNAGAAATALDAAIPNVVSRLSAITNPNSVVDVQGYGRLQDLATVIAGLDTQLSAADAATAFTQLASGAYYGSLQAVSTTAAFGDAADTPVGTEGGLGLWFRPTGIFARFDGDAVSGASGLRADNYGGSMGIGVSTGNGGTFGIGGGYGRIDARDRSFPSRASADTYMLGAFAHQRIGALDLAAQIVFGWSNWTTSRSMPLFSRTATAAFDSRELRINGRIGYDFELGGAVIQPFAKVEARRYTFNGFEEQNAGGIGLAVGKRSETVFSPEAGLQIAGNFAGIRPFVEGSYVFQGDVNGYRDVAYLGDPATTFRLQGIDPNGYAKIGGGVSGDLYGASFSLRANYLTGGGNSAGEVRGGITLRF